MSQTPIYTIGYGARQIEEFISVLRDNQIAYLIDVRTKPYSRYKPEFSKRELARRLEAAEISYVYMGDLLGGLPDDPDCYEDGEVQYEKVEQKAYYRQGIARLEKAYRQQLRVALMCSEGKPEQCHRSKLIGETLSKMNIPVMHIDENDQLVSHEEVLNMRILKGQPSLLPDFHQFKSRKRYGRGDDQS